MKTGTIVKFFHSKGSDLARKAKELNADYFSAKVIGVNEDDSLILTVSVPGGQNVRVDEAYETKEGVTDKPKKEAKEPVQ